VYPIEQVSGAEAILVAMMPSLYKGAEYNAPNCAASNTCQYCFDDGAHATTPDSVEYPYFALLHETVEASYCVDENRQYFAGYSSGGWMAHQLGCEFPDVLRAQGSVTGGLPDAIANGSKTCKDHPVAAMLIHDFNDRSNPYSGSVAALQRLLALNRCAGGTTMATAPTAPYEIASVPSTAVFSCEEYVGCPIDYPIVFCTSTDQQHNSQTTNAVPEFWDFFRGF
jgi:poly(3-hydroxybutyrate) depolymerase